MAANARSAYLPSFQALPGLTNEQISELRQVDAAAPQQLAAASDVPEADVLTAVEGHMVAGRVVGNGTFDAEAGRAAVRSQHYGAFFHY
ncbi:unnamed protein product, partial [Mesorhabditis spiculigera]